MLVVVCHRDKIVCVRVCFSPRMSAPWYTYTRRRVYVGDPNCRFTCITVAIRAVINDSWRVGKCAVIIDFRERSSIILSVVTQISAGPRARQCRLTLGIMKCTCKFCSDRANRAHRHTNGAVLSIKQVRRLRRATFTRQLSITR